MTRNKFFTLFAILLCTVSTAAFANKSSCEKSIVNIVSNFNSSCLADDELSFSTCKDGFVESLHNVIDNCSKNSDWISKKCRSNLKSRLASISDICFEDFNKEDSSQCRNEIQNGMQDMVKHCMPSDYSDLKSKKGRKKALRRFFKDLISFGPEVILNFGMSIPVYGNYCGPNHGDDSYQKEPIDAIDNLCMKHDKCYDANYGGFTQDCFCDTDLVGEIDKELERNNKLALESKFAASAFKKWFDSSSCSCKIGKSRTMLYNPSKQLKSMCE